ncbi:hypothetical protein HDV02_003062 [Globomyces sp. JEL0801]|nr:hypothetical protein HDV02_003062 [Globomyces sp. JEL0801]
MMKITVEEVTPLNNSLDDLKTHFWTIQQTLEHFNVKAHSGLSSDQVTANKLRFGENKLEGDTGPSIWKVLFDNIFNYMNAVLIGALIVSLAVLDWVKVGVLLLVIITNSGIGFMQEYRSEKTMDALRQMSSPTAKVLRDGMLQEIPSSQVVPGDILTLETGAICPADLRLIDAVNLETDEAFLTGESLPIPKNTRALVRGEEEPSVGDRVNLAYMNSKIVKGRGTGVVISIAFKTEVGKIATLVSEGEKKPKKTPLMITLDRLMIFCVVAAVVLGIFVFAIEKFQWSTDTFLYAISVGIALLPEGLPAVITVVLALGLSRMSKQKALVRKLPAMEAVGQVTNICSDKTGTLTEGKMVARFASFGGMMYKISGEPIAPVGKVLHLKGEEEIEISPEMVNSREELKSGLLVASLCTTSNLFIDKKTNQWKATGAPTEIALQVLAAKMSFLKADLVGKDYEFIHEYPFDSSVKRMTTVYKHGEEYVYFSKGALDMIISQCHKYSENGQIHPITPEKTKSIIDIMEDFAGKGMRVLAMATKHTQIPHVEGMARQDAESEMVFVGLVAIYDPPRPESLPSVQECRTAGIVVHMATGDHPKTAEAIAREVGILLPTDPPGSPLVMIASHFDQMTDNEIDQLEKLPLVLARCAPESKVRLVGALHRRGKYVAMTGDGVNDAPAVKQADIGIAMGLTGSEVTKQASAITLTDDNFRSILSAVREGRCIFTNITQIALHLLSGNVSEVIVLIFGLAIRDSEGHTVFPMSAIQILWLNMITSSPVALALGVEAPASDIMQHPPRKAGSSIINTHTLIDLFFYGFWLGSFSLGTFIASLHYDVGIHNIPPRCGKEFTEGVCEPVYAARALSFYSLSLLILVHGFNCRHLRLSAFRKDQVQNYYLWGAIAFGIAMTIPTAFIPQVNVYVFEQSSFAPGWWIILLAQVVVFLIISEIYKFFKRKYYGIPQAPNHEQVPLVVTVEKP